MTHSVTWDTNFEASPTDANYGYEIDDKIREVKNAIRERMELDHIWKTSTTTDGLIKAHRSRVSVSEYTGQSIATGTYAKLLWTAAETYDNLTEFATGKFTASEAGYYHFSFNVGMMLASGKIIAVQAYKNGRGLGAPYAFQAFGHGSAIYGQFVNAGFDIYLTAGEYIELYVLHDDTVSRTVYGGLHIHRFA
jgi:hypothetical protein